MIDSTKPTAYRTTFGKSERKESKKVLEPFKMAEIENVGKEGKGPGAYLPPRYVLENGETIESKDPTEKYKYHQVRHALLSHPATKFLNHKKSLKGNDIITLIIVMTNYKSTELISRERAVLPQLSSELEKEYLIFYAVSKRKGR